MRILHMQTLGIKAFLAILLVRLTNQPSFDLYWSMDEFIQMSGFRNILQQDWFLRIFSFFSSF